MLRVSLKPTRGRKFISKDCQSVLSSPYCRRELKVFPTAGDLTDHKCCNMKAQQETTEEQRLSFTLSFLALIGVRQTLKVAAHQANLSCVFMHLEHKYIV